MAILLTYHIVPGKEVHDTVHRLNRPFESLHDCCVSKELNNRFLVHVSTPGAPPERGVFRGTAIDGGLPANGPPTVTRKAKQVRKDKLRPAGKRLS